MLTIQDYINYCKPFYDNQSRYYHDWNHINNMIKKLEEWERKKTLLIDDVFKPILLKAILFHDIVYNIYQSDKDNIKQSIELYNNFTDDDDKTRNKVIFLINATDYSIPLDEKTIEQRVITDLDLSILASDKETYLSYSINIQKEYKIINESFINKRIKILESLLELAIQKDLFIILPEMNKIAIKNIHNEIVNLTVKK